MKQPGMFAWQVFDDKTTQLLRGEYRIRRITKAEADTLEELAPKLDGVDPEAFLRTVRAFNAACRGDVPFNPNILDGRAPTASRSTRPTGRSRSIRRPTTPTT